MVTHLMFDFFGTLVQYIPDRLAGMGYPRTYALLTERQIPISYADFVEQFETTFRAFERESQATLDEFHMHAVVTAFLIQVCERQADPALVHAFTETYLAEWNRGVAAIPGLAALIETLAQEYTLSVLSNTHYPVLVPRLLEAIGIRPYFRQVLTSVEHGKRKPHPSIFQAALMHLGFDAAQVLYIGDTYVDDYLGATGCGMRAVLIDTQRRALHLEGNRVDSVLDLPVWLASGR